MPEKEKKLSAKEICTSMKFNQNTRGYVEHKYKNDELTNKEWKAKFKKDRLSY